MNKHPVGIAAIEQAEDFFGKSDATRLNSLGRRLDDRQIDYLIEEDFALIAHGCSWGTNRVVFRVPTEHYETAKGLFDGMPDVRVRSGGDISNEQTPIGDLKFLRLELFIERKLECGMIHAGRIGDLADVQGLIYQRELDERFATKLDSPVREQFLQLVREVRDNPVVEE